MDSRWILLRNKFCIYSAFAERIEDSMWIYVTESEYTRKGADSLQFAKQIVNSQKKVLDSKWIHYEFTTCLANFKWIRYLFHESTIFSRYHLEYSIFYDTFCALALNPVSFSRIHYEFYLFQEFTMISLSFLRIRHGFTI